MNWQGSHLSDRQIEEYVSEISADRPSLQNQEAHIAACDACRKRVLEAERTRLGVVQRNAPRIPFPGCLDEEILQQYAAGLCTEDMAAKVIHHAAHCDFCAPLLKAYMEDLSDDLTADAKDFLDRLPASKPEWRRLAGEHAPQSPGLLARLRKFFFFETRSLGWRTAAAAGGLALVALVAVVLTNLIHSRGGEKAAMEKADRLTVAAFRENPRTDLRYAWAPHTWDTKLAGGNPPVASSSLHALHEAQFLADQHQDSSDPNWLRINGRLALFTHDPNAVGFLQSAYDKGLKDPSTEVDLAAAYFLRDTSNTKTNDPTAVHDVYATIDLLLKVLKEPELATDTRAAALFNLAVAYETMLQWDQAVPVWEQYLKLDSNGPWAEEAGRRLQKDRSHIPLPRPEGYRNPAFFENHSSDDETQGSIEEYQDAALRTWLLDLAGSHAAEAARATHMLAETLQQRHGDPWLTDFLARRQLGDWPGVEALSAAITSNRRGEHREAKRHAETAAKIFEGTANTPGVLRSQFEAMYANQRLLKSELCVEQAQVLDSALRRTAYRWLQIQTALTQASCLNRNKDFEAADEKLAIGYQDAVRFGFHILELRAVMLNAGMKVDRDCNESRRIAAAGLDLYWRGPSSPFWLYQLYSTMKQCLQKENLAQLFEAKWHAEEALERRMISILETEINVEDRNAILEETAHRNLQLLTELNEPAPAAAANPVRQPAYLLPLDLDHAEIQLRDGHPRAALMALDSMENLVTTTGDDLIRLNFYRVRGDACLKLQQLDAAERAYTTGLEMAEQAFGGLKNDAERLQWMKEEMGEFYRGLVGVFLARGRSEQALELWEWCQSRLWISDSREAHESGISWRDIEGRVRIPTSALDTRVIYAFVKDRIFVWTLGGSGLKAPQAIPIAREQLQQLIRDYNQEIRTENSNIISLEDDSQRLFSLLLKPAMAELRGNGTVVVELDPLMNEMPLEALQSPEGWYFGQRYPIIYSPGLMEESRLRAPAQRPPTSRWLLNALTTNDREIGDQLPGIKVLNAAGMTPGKLSSLLGDSDMFIFLGHGESGALQLGSQAPLRAEDFPPESLQKLQVTALVACSSGSGGDSLLATTNLVHAMLSGGVPAVIASHWDVSRDSTTRLLTGFYDHLIKGEIAARSMLEARQQVFRGGNTHPYYWAAFTLTGKAR